MKTNRFLLLLGILVPAIFLFYPTGALFFTACAPAQYEASRKPVFEDLYSFPKFNIPETRKAGSVNITTVITIPEYKDTYNQEYAGGAKVSAGGPMSVDMVKVFKSFAGTVGEDIEAQLVAKGMTTKGPFPMSEITYPDKKGADLTVSINVVLDIQYNNSKYLGWRNFEDGEHGKMHAADMSVGVKVYYYMLEPLSEEKMWIKKLDLGVQSFPYEYVLAQEQYAAGSDGCGGQVYSYRDTNRYIYDTRPKIFSDVLKEAYPKILKNAWTYLDTDEMLNLKLKSQEIRERKRY